MLHTVPLSVCLAVTLLAAAPSYAAVKTFGPEFQRFTLDVPDKWTEASQEGGIRLISPDGKTVVAVSVGHSEGKSVDAIAERVARDLSATELKKLDENTYSFEVTSENTPVYNVLRANDEVFIISSVGGDSALGARWPIHSDLSLTKTGPGLSGVPRQARNILRTPSGPSGSGVSRSLHA